jgi:hypothetical protein
MPSELKRESKTFSDGKSAEPFYKKILREVL